MTTEMEPLCDLRESMVAKYVTITHRRAGQTVREEHWIFTHDSYPRIFRWDVNTFMPGRGRYQIGDRLEYTGKGPQYVEDVPIGTKATITHDNGFDYRYTLTFDEPVRISFSSLHPEGEFEPREKLRSGGSGWTKINDD
jgi:hypothetical protein